MKRPKDISGRALKQEMENKIKAREMVIRDSLVIADANVQARHREPVRGLFVTRRGEEIGGKQRAQPLIDLAVSTVPPLALLPVVLEVLCLGALLVVTGVVQGVLQTTLAALTQTEEQESSNADDNGRGGSHVDSNVSAVA